MTVKHLSNATLQGSDAFYFLILHKYTPSGKDYKSKSRSSWNFYTDLSAESGHAYWTFLEVFGPKISSLKKKLCLVAKIGSLQPKCRILLLL